MAKSNTPTRESSPKVPAALIPKPTDPRSELFYLLGELKGNNIHSASRIAELVITLIDPSSVAEVQETE